MKPMTGRPWNVAVGETETSWCAPTAPDSEDVKSKRAQPFCALTGNVAAVRSFKFADPSTLLPLNVTTFASKHSDSGDCACGGEKPVDTVTARSSRSHVVTEMSSHAVPPENARWNGGSAAPLET